ncbi:MAG: tRNA pseudouridine(55) synthase TruB [Oscillospiraceae bacterium]|jgi:tRNA pseudouridine55 synthase
MNGILLVNKPQGFTSFDVIAKLRGILKIKRLGHSGTLDPLATGVLPVFIGKATRACDILPNNVKSYTAGFRLGISTDTQDITGAVTDSSDMMKNKGDVETALSGFLGETDQLPPMYSAVSVGGRRLYELARQGIEIERTPRKIKVSEIRLLDFDEKSQTGTIFISCSKGTYIRTIIHDIGQMLGSYAVMTSLVRNSSSGFLLEHCLTLEEIISLKESNRLLERIIPVEKAFNCYEKISLDEIQTKKYKNGIRLDANRISHKSGCEIYSVFGFDGLFLGLANIDIVNLELVSIKNFY